MTPLIAAPGTPDPRDRFPRVLQILSEGHGRLHLGAQVFIRERGVVQADFGFGEALPGISMTPGTIVPWLSAGKPLTAAAALVLEERGDLCLDEPIAAKVPEFAAGGKDRITLRHILTHTAGFRNVDPGWPDASWEESVARVCAAEIEEGWTPGARAGYHIASSWLILGELLRRETGIAFPAAIRQLVLDPLRLTNTFCGMTSDEWQANRSRIGGLYQRTAPDSARQQGSVREEERESAGAERMGEHSPSPSLPFSPSLSLAEWHTQHWCAAPSPGGGFRGPVRELARFYESLLGSQDVPRLLKPETVAAMTDRQRVGMSDETLQHVVDFGLGVIVDSNRYGAATVPYGFGRHSSDRTFGHGGSQCSMAFADPEADLAVAWAANGRPGEPQHQRRNRAINQAIYEDLGLSGE